jgi:hypothetical protein
MHAEITLQDVVGNSIYNTVVNKQLRKNLELGSWSGEGSTNCFVQAMQVLGGDLHIDCVEIIPEKFLHLQKMYEHLDFVHCHNKSSISYDELLYKDFEDVWNSPYNKIPKHVHPKELVKSWYDRDVECIKEADSMNLGALSSYDSVFLDGSEFTGYSEFVLIRDKARVIFIDDVHQAFKCFQIYDELIKSDQWVCLTDAPNWRNGFAVFEKKI